jgi:hypothetical protein
MTPTISIDEGRFRSEIIVYQYDPKKGQVSGHLLPGVVERSAKK